MKVLKAIFKKKDTRRKLLFTLLILLLIQTAAGIPTPGVNTDYFKELVTQNSGLGFLNLISGNGLGNLSITMLSVTPYITATIIFQLMELVFKGLSEIRKDGAVGEKRIKKYSMILGGFLGAIQSFGIAFGFSRNPEQCILIDRHWYWIVLVIAIWTGASIVITLCGDLIDKKGISGKGQGVSLILLCNIIAGYPSDTQSVYEKFLMGQNVTNFAIRLTVILVLVIALFCFTDLVHETDKRLPVTYSTKTAGEVRTEVSVFPIKLCPGTVVPIIFASSLMSFPSLVVAFFGGTVHTPWKGFNTVMNWIINALNSMQWFQKDHMSYSFGVILYVVLIFAFTYFYVVDIIMNPVEIAENFKKSGGMFPNIRPGEESAKYLKKQMKYVLAIGAVALTLIALIPSVLSGVFGISRLSFFGSSVIITIGVLDEFRDRLLADIQTELRYGETKRSKRSMF